MKPTIALIRLVNRCKVYSLCKVIVYLTTVALLASLISCSSGGSSSRAAPTPTPTPTPNQPKPPNQQPIPKPKPKPNPKPANPNDAVQLLVPNPTPSPAPTPDPPPVGQPDPPPPSSGPADATYAESLIPGVTKFLTNNPLPNGGTNGVLVIMDIFPNGDTPTPTISQRSHGEWVYAIPLLIDSSANLLRLHFSDFAPGAGRSYNANLSKTWDRLPATGNLVVNLSSSGRGLFSLRTANSDRIKLSQLEARATTILTLPTGNGTPGDTASLAQPSFDLTILSKFLDTGRVILTAGLNYYSNPTTIHPASHHCGDTKHYCLTAPYSITVDGYVIGGTSYAAPLTAISARLIWDRWPTMTAKQVVTLLLDCATDMGASGVDNIYGRGRLNLNCTFASTAGQNQLQSQEGPRLAGALYMGGTKLSSLELPGYDSYGRDFNVTLPVLSRFPTPPWQMLTTLTETPFTHSTHSALSPNGMLHHQSPDVDALMGWRKSSQSAFTTAAWETDYDKFGMMAGWHRQHSLQTHSGLFVFLEKNAFAGSYGTQALKFGDSVSVVAHVATKRDLPHHWQLGLHWSVAASHMVEAASDSVMLKASGFQTEVNFLLTRKLRHGCLKTSLAFHSGQYGALQLDQQDLTLRPNSSEQWQLGYSYPCR